MKWNTLTDSHTYLNASDYYNKYSTKWIIFEQNIGKNRSEIKELLERKKRSKIGSSLLVILNPSNLDGKIQSQKNHSLFASLYEGMVIKIFAIGWV